MGKKKPAIHLSEDEVIKLLKMIDRAGERKLRRCRHRCVDAKGKIIGPGHREELNRIFGPMPSPKAARRR